MLSYLARLRRARGGLLAGALLAGCRGAAGDRGAEPLDPQLVREGAQVYAARCASCHGARGEGAPQWKRPLPGGAYPPPPHDSTGHTWHHADGLLHRIVVRGGADTLQRAGPSGMPAFGDSLSPREIRAVITYLKTMWTAEQRRFQAEVSRQDPSPASGT